MREKRRVKKKLVSEERAVNLTLAGVWREGEVINIVHCAAMTTEDEGRAIVLSQDLYAWKLET